MTTGEAYAAAKAAMTPDAEKTVVTGVGTLSKLALSLLGAP